MKCLASNYPKQVMFTELSSKRQVKRLKKGIEIDRYKELSDDDRKYLKRSQFAFGSFYPYVFDGLSYISTYCKDIICDKDKYFYSVELPLNNFIKCCLRNWTSSKTYLRDELLANRFFSFDDKEASKKNAKFLRYVPISRGDYISIQPIMIGYRYKDGSDVSNLELNRVASNWSFRQFYCC